MNPNLALCLYVCTLQQSVGSFAKIYARGRSSQTLTTRNPVLAGSLLARSAKGHFLGGAAPLTPSRFLTRGVWAAVTAAVGGGVRAPVNRVDAAGRGGGGGEDDYDDVVEILITRTVRANKACSEATDNRVE